MGTRFLSELENGKPSLHIGKVVEVLHAVGLGLTVERRRTGASPSPLPALDRAERIAMQSEARTELARLHQALQRRRDETGAYERAGNDFGESPRVLAESRYLYFFQPTRALGGQRLPDRGRAVARAQRWLRKHRIRPRVSRERFLLVAITPGDGADFDAWTIDEHAQLRHVSTPEE